MTEIRTSLRSPLRSPLFSHIIGRWNKPNPFSLFTAGIDFAAGTAFGGTQPYGNNTDDGRLFRDPTNTLACIIPNADGSWSNITDASGSVIALSANTECPIDNAIPMSMRVNFTRTSGTLVASITSQIPA